MKKFILCGLFCLMLLGGCQGQAAKQAAEMNGGQQKVLDLTSLDDRSAELVNRLVDLRAFFPNAFPIKETTATVTDEQHMSAKSDMGRLRQKLADQASYWHKTPFAFTIENLQAEKPFVYEGEFESPEHWKVKGEYSNGDPFVLESKGEETIFTFAGTEEHFAADVFTSLSPLQHLDMVIEMIASEQFEFFIWHEQMDALHIDIRANAEMMRADFEQYLANHMQLDQFSASIHPYVLEYGVTMNTKNWQVEKLSFILKKDEQVLESLLFQWQKVIK